MSRKIDFSGRYAIVTGSAGGIGFEFAKALALKGCSLILIDINQERLQSAVAEIKSVTKELNSYIDIYCLTLDLSDENLIEKIEEYCGNYSLDPTILINNAGIFSFNPIADTSSKKIELFIDLHVRAVTLISRWFCNRCRAKGEGWLLNMSSMSCWMPMPGIALYSATKAYIRVLSRAMHYELKDSGVTVTVACPGGIATDLFGLPENLRNLAVKLGVLALPETFARKAVRKMLKGRKQYINGLLNRISIFAVAVTPTPVRMLVKRKMLDKGIRV